MSTNNNINKKLSLEEMQELLPDYAFDKLSSSEKEIFETNLQFYPELKGEIENISSVFEKINDLDYNRYVQEQSKNLSVAVNSRKSGRDYRRSRNLGKFVLPIGMLMLAAYFIGEYELSSILPFINTGHNSSAILYTKDLQTTFDAGNLDEFEKTEYSTKLEDIAVLIDRPSEVDDLLNEIFDINISEANQYLDLTMSGSILDSEITRKNINKYELSEEEFQEFIRAIENVKFD